MNITDIKKVIYINGQTNLESTVYAHADGSERVAYSGYTLNDGKDLTVGEYLKNKPQAVCISFDEAMERMAEAEEAVYIRPWSEITEDEWMDALEVLPPQKWQTIEGVEMFRMSEYTTGNITAHYARFNGRHFSANRRTSDQYEILGAEIKALAA